MRIGTAFIWVESGAQKDTVITDALKLERLRLERLRIFGPSTIPGADKIWEDGQKGKLLYQKSQAPVNTRLEDMQKESLAIEQEFDAARESHRLEMEVLNQQIEDSNKIFLESCDAVKQRSISNVAKLDLIVHGPLNNKLLCQQCGEHGFVHSKLVSKKQGISGGKAVAALFTGGISMLALGLSRKEKITEAYCSNCKSTWHF